MLHDFVPLLNPSTYEAMRLTHEVARHDDCRPQFVGPNDCMVSGAQEYGLPARCCFYRWRVRRILLRPGGAMSGMRLRSRCVTSTVDLKLLY